jgi:hypothetical protein
MSFLNLFFLSRRSNNEQKKGQSLESVCAVFHDRVVAGPIVSSSKTVARFAVAERALSALRDSGGELVKNVCDCRDRMETDEEITEGRIDLTEGADSLEELEVANMLIVEELE